jgi:Fur family transcriptional regulator, ferric uptake regulator
MPAIDGRPGRTATSVKTSLSHLDRAVSAQELYRLLHERGEGVGLATVYRALDGLVAAGEAERIRRAGEDTYVLCPTQHHHHAICRLCGKSDVLEQCSLEDAEPMRSSHGFLIDDHQTVYFGRCPECA